MSEQHAPWHVSHSQQGWDALVYDTHSRLVATVNCMRDDGDKLADFIAAAPDLLAACEALVDELSPGDGCNGCGWSYGHNDTCVVLAALLTIAKAKGAR
jgi:hypothetical protein